MASSINNTKKDYVINEDLVKHLQSGIRLPTEKYEKYFSTLLNRDFTDDELVAWFNSPNFINEIKPFLIDLLKRIHRFKPLIESLEKVKARLDNKPRVLLGHLTERHLICALVEAVSEYNQPRLGFFIAKNAYPLPLCYQISQKTLNQRINFHLFKDVLCLTDRPMAILSNSKATLSFKKDTVIPFAFPHIAKSYVLDNAARTPEIFAVDVYGTHESNESCLVADFSGLMNTNETRCLYRALSTFSFAHLLVANFSDFNEKGDVIDQDIADTLEWYRKLMAENNAQQSTHLIVLLENSALTNSASSDSEDIYGGNSEHEANEQKEKMRMRIQESLKVGYSKDYVHVELLNDGYELRLNATMDKLVRATTKSFHTIGNIEKFYAKQLADQPDKFKMQVDPHPIETTVKRHLNLDLNKPGDLAKLKSIFQLSNLSRSIAIIDEELLKLNMLMSSSEQHGSSQIHEQKIALEKERSAHKDAMSRINKIHDGVQFFIDLVLAQTSYTDMLVLEKCLIQLKGPALRHLKEERKKSSINDKRKEELDLQIEDIDLTLDKFWDEVFMYFELEAIKQQPQYVKMMGDLVAKFIELLSNGFSIHLLRGRPLHVQSEFLSSVFKKIDALQQKNEKSSNFKIHVLSVIGEQSSAKSSLLNSLFGMDFRTQSGRCTIGIYMNWIHLDDSNLLVILDTEGLSSVEGGNATFDNQMATMSVLGSNMIMLNHKGEISTNLERLLGITFFAKLRISRSSFKPSVVFVLRDQLDRQAKNQEIQAMKLKENLKKSAKHIDTPIDEVLQIDTENIRLLPCAFSEMTTERINYNYAMRNPNFAVEVLNLKKFLLAKQEANSRIKSADGQLAYPTLDSLHSLFVKLNTNWITLQNLGGGILDCKDLEELRVRNEISAKANSLLEENMVKLNSEFAEIKNKQIEILSKQFDESVFKSTEATLESIGQRIKKEAVDKFKSQTNVSFYPEQLRSEFSKRIESSLANSIRYHINDFVDLKARFKQRRDLDSINEDIIRYITQVLTEKNVTSIDTLMGMLNDKFAEQDKIFEQKQAVTYLSEDELASSLQACYLNTLRLMGNSLATTDFASSNIKFTNIKSPHLDVNNNNLWVDTGKINEIRRKSADGKFMQMVSSIMNKFRFSSSTSTRIPTPLGPEDFAIQVNSKIMSDLNTVVLPKIAVLMKSNTVEVNDIRNALQIIHEYLYDPNSIIMEVMSYVNIVLVATSFVECALKSIYRQMLKHQYKKQKEEAEKYAKSKEEIREQVEKEFNNKKNSRQSGIDFAQLFLQKALAYTFDRDALLIENEIKMAISEFFNNPESLVDFAYKTSFDALDYSNVYKYVVDMKRFYLELLELKSRSKVDLLIQNRIAANSANMNAFIKLIREFDYANVKVKTKYEFLDMLNGHIKKDDSRQISIYSQFIEEHRKLVIDGVIENFELFKTGLMENFELKDSDAKIKEFKATFDKSAKEARVKCLNHFIGCEANCPCCGAKCIHESGHTGEHKANLHLIKAFKGWRYQGVHTALLTFCWNDHNVIYGGEQRVFPNVLEFVKEIHPDWLSDVTHVMNTYGQADSAKTTEFINRREQLMKCWMNMRFPLMKHYRKDMEFHDCPDYSKEWLDAEDKSKQLNEDFTPTWKQDAD